MFEAQADLAGTYLSMLSFVLIVGIPLFVAYLVIEKLLKSPFKYPYYVHEFDVSGKRNVDIENLIEEFLLDPENVEALRRHDELIEDWKRQSEEKLESCVLKGFRLRQYEDAIDDDCAYCFIATRDQTRYRQRSHVKTSYKVKVDDSELDVSMAWLEDRLSDLEDIGYEATLKDYHAKNQRRLMTPALRQQIMERDNYTCQICGKYMPDKVGLHIDHIVPIAKGGKTVPSNLQVLCSRCNGGKGSK